MKKIFCYILLLSIFASISSCEKDEGKLPGISFKTGGNYTSSDARKPGGSPLVIGVQASKTEDKDVLKKFNISKSVNGAPATSIYNKDLSGSEEDNFNYDYSATMDSIPGQTNKYVFTITNRDGLTNQVSLTVTVQ